MRKNLGRAIRLILGLIPLVCSTLATAQSLPSADEILQRLLDRSSGRAAATNAPVWAYNKRTVTEKLDANGKVEDRTERLYRVRMVQGVPVAKLVKVEGRELNEEELKKENQNDAAFRKRISGRDPKKAVARQEALITTNLAERFQFTALRRELVQGHQTVVVGFTAKPSKGKNSIPDQLINRLAGTLWVDEASADVAQLEVHLTKDVSLGAMGMLGTIRDCRLKLASKPMTDGTWLPEKSDLSMSARIFVSSLRFRMQETSDDYTLETEPQPISP